MRVTSDILDVVEITFRSCTLSGAVFMCMYMCMYKEEKGMESLELQIYHNPSEMGPIGLIERTTAAGCSSFGSCLLITSIQG